MHMTPNLNLGMSKQRVESLFVKVLLITLTFVIVMNAMAGSSPAQAIDKAYNNSMTTVIDWVDGQLQQYEKETWDQRIRRLMRSNLEELGGTRKALADKQVKCLAENIYYESRGESLEGQIAVAKVTLNRLDEGFARTVCGVVKQGCQFSWVCEPINSQPGGAPWIQAVGIAALTINQGDKVEDPTNGATHFHATYINWQPTWKRVKDSVNKIGNHIFYRVKPKEEK